MSPEDQQEQEDAAEPKKPAAKKPTAKTAGASEKQKPPAEAKSTPKQQAQDSDAEQSTKPKATKPAAKSTKAKASEDTKASDDKDAGTEDGASDASGEEPKEQQPKPKARSARRTKSAPEDTEEPASKPAARAKRGQPARKTVRAHARYVRTSARKARMVCGHIRGKSVGEARAILTFTPRDVARDWSKLLESAIANAENNHELLEDDLVVAEAYADEGPTLKRSRPRAFGSSSPINKRTSHLTITLTSRPQD